MGNGPRFIKIPESAFRATPDAAGIGSGMVEAMEAAWREIQTHVSDLPDVVIVVSPVSKAGKFTKYGHYAGLRWTAGDKRHAEVLIAAEGLSRGGRGVFETLLHESVHAIAEVRKIRDTSRQGRYHNKQFARLAESVGLVVKPSNSIGYHTPDVTDDTAIKYAKSITRLDAECRAYRSVEGGQGNGSRNGIVLVCGCFRKIRMTESVAEIGPIVCGSCQEEFLLEGARGAHGVRLPSDNDFVQFLLNKSSARP